MELFGFTIEMVGKIMVAFTALMVHHRVWTEKSIDKRVFRAMRREQVIGFLGILLMVAGYFLQLPAKI